MKITSLLLASCLGPTSGAVGKSKASKTTIPATTATTATTATASKAKKQSKVGGFENFLAVSYV